MTYNADFTWADLSNIAGQQARNVMGALRAGENSYSEWQSFRAGRTNAQIATALSRTEGEVAEMDSTFAAFNALQGYSENGTPTQSDYAFSMRKFS